MLECQPNLVILSQVQALLFANINLGTNTKYIY